MRVPDSIGCGEKRKGDEWPQDRETQIPDFVLISARMCSLKESAAGTLSRDELRNSRMSLDKCLLDK